MPEERVFTGHSGKFFLFIFVSLRRWTLMIPQLPFRHEASTLPLEALRFFFLSSFLSFVSASGFFEGEGSIAQDNLDMGR